MTVSTSDRPALVAARLDDLVYARLATSPRPLAHAAVVAALRADAPPTCDALSWSTAIFEATARLQASGAVDARRQVEGGAPAAAKRLGGTGTPSWQRLHQRILPALALGIDADDTRAHDRLVGRDAWVAAIVGRARGVWTEGGPPSLGAVCDALVWQGLGLAGRPRRTPGEIRAHFLGQLLGAGGGAPERRAALLAAREVGAVRADVRALRDALVRRWLCGLRWPAAGTDSLASFAQRVHLALGRASAGPLGPRKVFIADVWRDAAFADLPLAAFKAQLLEAHRAGAVRLARADLVAAVEPALVHQSALPHLEATYHVIEKGQP
ncbi:MAG: hypothetical protein R3B06_00670 [Kofleriaceae bacterium]